MINGRLYDTETLNEIGNYNKPRSKFSWETRKNWEAFGWQSNGETSERGILVVAGIINRFTNLLGLVS